MIATRVMKARRAGLCGYCGGWMSVGTSIALVGRVWMHLDPCALAHLPSAPRRRSA